MKTTTILSLFIITSVLASITMPYNVNAEEPSLDQLLWEGLPFTELSDMDSGWTQVYGSIDYIDGGMRITPSSTGSILARLSFTDPVDIKRCNPAFRLKIEGPLPSYLTFRMTFTDTSGKTMFYNFYNKATKLVGSEDYRTHFISWVDTYYNTTGFNPKLVNRVDFRFYSNSDQWAPVFDDFRAYPEINLYGKGFVIITSDGTRSGLVYLADKLGEYGYKFSPAVEPSAYTDEALIQSLYAQGHDPQRYVRLFDLSDSTVLLPSEEIYANTVEADAWLEDLCPGHEVISYNCNRHLSDENINAMFPDKIIKGSGFTSSAKLTMPFRDEYGGTVTDMSKILNGLTHAAESKTGYIVFDHFYAFDPSKSYIKTPEEIDQIVDRIHGLGLKVVTWTEYRNDILAYLGTPPPDPVPSDFFTVELNGDGFNIIENGIMVEHFASAEELADYVKIRAEIWEVNR